MREDSIQNSIIVRQCLTSDLERLHEIETECVGALSIPYAQLKWLVENQAPGMSLQVRVALEHGGAAPILGFAVFKQVQDEARNHLEILSLSIGKHFRDEGVAEALFRSMQDFGREQKALGISVMVSKSNSEGLKIYERLGFVLNQSQKGLFSDGSEACILTRRI